MFWKILLSILGGLSLIIGILKVFWDNRRKKKGRKPKRDVAITLGLSLTLVIIAQLGFIINHLKPSKTEEALKPIPEMAETEKRIEEKIDQLLERKTGEPTRYQDGIPQSPNLNLRKLFEEGQKHLDNYEYDSAIKAFRAGLALQELTPSEAAALLIHIGIVQHKQSKWDEAQGSWKEAFDWAEKGEDEQGQAAALGNLGLVYKAKGEWDKAIEFYNEDLEISKKIGDEHGMAQTYGNMGNVYRLKGEWDKAIEFYNKDLEISKKIGDEHGMAITYMNLGNVYQLNGKLDKAIEFYEKSLKIREKIGDEHGVAQTKANIGILYKEQGKKDEARKLLQESLKTLEKIGDRPNAELVREHLKHL